MKPNETRQRRPASEHDVLSWRQAHRGARRPVFSSPSRFRDRDADHRTTALSDQSLAGERLATVVVNACGLEGDRLWRLLAPDEKERSRSDSGAWRDPAENRRRSCGRPT
jgi:hypothetical protein